MQRRAAILCCLFAATTTARANVWIVDQTGGGHFTSIQPAIDAAFTGDEIIVRYGTYRENLDFSGKDLWVHSDRGPAATVVDGSGNGTCVRIASGESIAATLEGFTLANGTGYPDTLETHGGGMFVENASATIRSCRFAYNTCVSGGGLYFDNAIVEVHDTDFIENRATSLGGAACGHGMVSFQGCLFESNSASSCGGAVDAVGNIIFEDCVIRDNRAGICGGIDNGSSDGHHTLRRCVLTGNRSELNHAGALRAHEGSFFLEDCVIADNRSNMDGGGLFLIDGAYAFVTGCTFHGNGAQRHGGQVAVSGARAHCELRNCIVASGVANGGIYGNNGAVEFLCSDVWGNAGGDFVGCDDPTGSYGNFSADPRLCAPAALDFALASDSPCAPGLSGACSLIGARDVGCGPEEPLHATTWGAIKASFSGPGR